MVRMNQALLSNQKNCIAKLIQEAYLPTYSTCKLSDLGPRLQS